MKWILLSQCAIGTALFGAVQEKIDGKRPIPVSFSTSSHNRIAIENGAVEKVFGDSSLFSVTVDPITGNAFVNLLEEIGETPATLSVVTSTGLVQDLFVSSQEGPSEQVLLQEAEEELFIKQETSLAKAADLFNQILEGKVPFGYGTQECDEFLELPSPLSIEPLKTLVGPFERISLYQITNRGSTTVVLSPDALKGNRSWSFLNVLELEPGQHALWITGSLKDEHGL